MNRSRKKSSYQVCYALVIVLAVFVVVCFLLFTADAKETEGTRKALDEGAVAELKSWEERDAGEAAGIIREADESRKEAVRVSVWESESIEESIRMSRLAEENELAASIAESIYQESVEAASLQAEWDALTENLAGSHLVPGEVRYDLDDTDLPYIRKLYSFCKVVGDSRAKNAIDCGIFTENEIISFSGKSVDEITPHALIVAGWGLKKVLFVVGLNDIGHYDGSNARFKEDLYNMIRQYKEINPTGTVYLQEVIPMPDDDVTKRLWYRHFMIPDFTKRIQEVCEELDCVCVTATPYADFKYINSEDHAHYGKEFYFLWAQTLANQMHLWEDWAGLPYEVDYTKYEKIK